MRRRLIAAVAAVAWLGMSAPILAAPDPGAVPALPMPAHLMQRAEGYVAAVNGGDLASTEAFRARDSALDVNAAIPAPVFENYFANQKRVTGGLTLVTARLNAHGQLEVLVRDRLYGGLHGVTLTLDGTPEQRASELDPGPAYPWAAEGEPLTPAGVAAQTRAVVAKACKAGVFSGAVLVARGDRVLMQTACGEASRRFHVPNTVETRFNLGSMDKMLTAVAVMQLAEAGKIGLDDPLSRFLDETWLAPEVARAVTVRQLLTHTSGLGDFLGAEYRKAPSRYREVADYKPLTRDFKPAFPPGTKFQYSNGGMLLAGAVIEAASGERYDDYVRRHILAVAGMTATGNVDADDPGATVAMGYTPSDRTPGGWKENVFANVYRGGPAGGGYSTVGDMFRFARALETGKLVGERSLEFLWTDHAPQGQVPNAYGAGFELRDTSAGRTVGHTGFLYGVSTRMSLFLDRGYVVVVLSNVEVGAPTLMDVLGEVVGRG